MELYARIVDDTRELWTFGDPNDREPGMRRLRGPRRDSEPRKRNSSLAAAFESRATVSRNIGIGA